MSRSHVWSTVGIVLGFLPQLGCTASRPILSEVAPSIQPAAPAAKAPAELPAAEAARACLATAAELEQNGYEAEAIVQYEKARQHDPHLTQVGRKLAVLYDRQGDSARALAEYQQALRNDPKDPDLLNDLGYFYYERKNWSEAEKQLRQALARKPQHPRAWVNLGLVLGEQGRYQESYAAFTKVVSPAQARSNVGVIQARQGKTEEARRTLRQALALEPELKQARLVLAGLNNTQALASDPAGMSNKVPPDRVSLKEAPAPH